MQIDAFLNLIRWDKPIGTILLFIPCALGTALCANNPRDFLLLLPFLAGSFFMRSSGCIINDIFDKDLDARVERTKSRPIASGAVTVKNAVIYAIILALLALTILVCFFSYNTIIFTLFSALLVVIYPLAKRYTYFPQLVLGFTFNYGVLVAAVELEGRIAPWSLVLYLACVCWTLAYDTIYGYMDIKDDKKIGVKSLSIYLESRNYKKILGSFFALFEILLLTAIFLRGGLFSIYLILLSLALAHHLYKQIKRLKISNPQTCMEIFKSNLLAGILAFCMILIS